MSNYTILEITNAMIRQANNLNEEDRFFDYMTYEINELANQSKVSIKTHSRCFNDQVDCIQLHIRIDSVHRIVDTEDMIRILNYTYNRLRYLQNN